MRARELVGHVVMALGVLALACVAWVLLADGATAGQIANKNYSDEQYEAMRIAEKVMKRHFGSNAKFASKFVDESTAKRQPDGSYLVTGYAYVPNEGGAKVRTSYKLLVKPLEGGKWANLGSPP